MEFYPEYDPRYEEYSNFLKEFENELEGEQEIVSLELRKELARTLKELPF